MSSVSSTGSDYNYYQQQVSDLEDQNAKARKTAKERENERIAELERKYDHKLREQEENTSRAVARTREAGNEALSSEREDNKAELDRLKKDTYDRYGRVSRDESDDYHRRLDELQDELDHRMSKDHEDARTREHAYERELARRDRAAESNTRRALDEARDSYARQRESSLESSRQSYDDLARSSEKRYEDLSRTRTQALNDEHRRALEALAGARTDYKRRMDRAQAAYDRKTSRQEKDLRQALTDHANQLRLSHERETRQLREKIGELVDAEGQYEKSGAQGRADAVHELENDWRRRFENQTQGYEHQLSDLKTQNERTEAYLAHQNHQNMVDRDIFTAHALNEQSQKNHEDMQDLQNAFLKDHEQQDALRKHDYEVQATLFDQRMSKAMEQNHETMKNQAEAFRSSSRAQRKSDRQQMGRLEAALHEQRTSSDTSLISPAAEAAMRRQIATQYEKTAQADQSRNRQETGRLREEYRQEFADLRDNDRMKALKASRDIASEHDQERAEYAQHLQELEYAKEAAIKDRDRDTQRQGDKMTRNFNRLLGRENRAHEEQLDELRGQDLSRLDAVREDASFDRKMRLREYNNKENKLIHDYEKKLSDQKTTYEDRLSDQKATYETTIRENERHYHNTLDEQTRAYEHKLAEQSQQFRERERMEQETYQDEIDKLKRSNQLLIQKRS